MLTSFLSVRSLLLAVCILMGASGVLPTLVSFRLQDAGVSSLLIGVVGTAYFAGLTIGSLRVAPLIQRVGHIRGFAAFVSLFSAGTLACALHTGVIPWAIFRLIQGFSMAGVLVCVESWLNEGATAETRGTILAAYMIVTYVGQAAGQFLLDLGNVSPAMPFMAASILLSLAVIPVVVTRISGPLLTSQPALSIRRLYAISPLGVVGVMATGLMLGAFYSLAAVYAGRLGLNRQATAILMSTTIVGGILLQWPIGWASDRFDRRRVIVATFGGAFVVSAAIAISSVPGIALLVLGGLFGGLVFALYPLCVAHTNDRLTSDQRVGASGGLVLAYSVGAASGPLAASCVMTPLGPSGLFAFIAFCAAVGGGFGLWRQSASEPVPSAEQERYQAMPQTTPVATALDPRAHETEEPAPAPAPPPTPAESSESVLAA